MEDVNCSTTHCLAGWITWLTPGGLELEKEINRRQEEGVPLYLPPVVRRYDMFARSPPASAALLIMNKAGLIQHFDGNCFTAPHEVARELIWKLADRQKEELREAKEKQLAKRRRARVA
jgi:hypothetical protein